MRILFVAPMPFFHDRGACHRVLSMAEAARRLGHEIDVATYHVGREISLPDVNVHRIRRLPFKPYGASYSLGRLVTDIVLFLKVAALVRKNRYDCIQGKGIIATSIAHLVRGSRKSPVIIFDVEGSLSGHLQRYLNHKLIVGPFSGMIRFFLSRSAVKRLVEKAETRLYRSSEILMANWALIGEVIRKKSGRAFRVVENMLCEDDFRQEVSPVERAQWRARYGFGPSAQVLVYTGNFAGYQGIDILIEAVALLAGRYPHLALLLVGEERPCYRALAQEKGVADRVVFAGQRPMDEMPRFLAMADILVSALNLDETNSTVKLITYLFQKKPIITTDIAPNRQVVNDRVAFLAPPEAGAFARMIEHVLAHPEEARLRADLVYAHGMRSFSFETLVERMGEIYGEAERLRGRAGG